MLDTEKEAKDIIEEVRAKIENDDPDYEIEAVVQVMLETMLSTYRSENIVIELDLFENQEKRFLSGEKTIEDKIKYLNDHCQNQGDEIANELFNRIYEKVIK